MRRLGRKASGGRKESNVAKYLDPKADVTFKKVFGEHKDLVISLLRDGADEVSQDLLDNPQTGEALEIVRESGLNDAERAAYEGFWDRVSIEATKKAYMDKAIAERDAANAERDAANARADAAEAKMRQDKLDTARQMKADGMAVETIVKYTGLTTGEIKAL